MAFLGASEEGIPSLGTPSIKCADLPTSRQSKRFLEASKKAETIESEKDAERRSSSHQKAHKR
jgi:hypothetical protein